MDLPSKISKAKTGGHSNPKTFPSKGLSKSIFENEKRISKTSGNVMKLYLEENILIINIY